MENKDVVEAAPTGHEDAPTTSEWSTMLLPTKVPTKVWLILETWRHT